MEEELYQTLKLDSQKVEDESLSSARKGDGGDSGSGSQKTLNHDSNDTDIVKRKFAELHSDEDQGIFSIYHSLVLVQSPTFEGQELEEISDLISRNGGKIIQPESLGLLTNSTIVIADSIDFAEYPGLSESMVNVVTPQWVRDSVNKQKGQNLKPYSPDPNFFFSGIMVCAAGLSKGDREALYAGVQAWGGQFSDGLSRATTHVLATNMTELKCQIALKAQPKIKIVLPHWIDDCLKLLRKVDETMYLLPDPPLLSSGNWDNNGVNGNSNNDNNVTVRIKNGGNNEIGPFLANSDPPKALVSDIFLHKRFFLAKDLDLSNRVLTSLQQLIINSGGEIVETVKDANVYVGKWREGEAYVEAARRTNCSVGNLDWVYWMVVHRKWSSPLRRLLHYPLVQGGLPDMRDCRISLTNFTGEARQFVERLITALGASYSSSLRQNCTHLIAARPNGLKYHAARQWNIHVVNHLWLEETYAEWAVQVVSLPRYVYMPPRIDLTCIVGQTQLLLKNLRRFYRPLSETPSSVTRLITAYDRLPSSSSGIGSPMAIRTPRAAGERAKAAVHDSMAKETEYQKQLKNRKELPPLAEELNDKGPPQYKKRVLEARSPAASSKTPINISPLVPAATRRGVGHGDEDVVGSDILKSSPPSRWEGQYGETDNNDLSHRHSRIRDHNGSLINGSVLPDYGRDIIINSHGRSLDNENDENIPSHITVVFTSVNKVSTPNKTAEIGIHQVNDSSVAEYIISPRVVRTEKFMIALNSAKAVLIPDYIDACESAGHILYPIPKKYILKDEKLSKALERARILRKAGHRLFDGYAFNVTPDIKGGFDVFNNIVQAHGALPCLLLSAAKPRKFVHSDGDKVILITSAADSSDRRVKAFKEHHQEQTELKTYVFTTEWVFKSILSMKVNLSDKTYAL